MRARFSRVRTRRTCALAVASLLLVASCASTRFVRETETSGTFSSQGLAVTILSIDLPKPALDIARENAADSNLANLVVNDVTVFPYLGWFDWLLDIVGLRFARIRGTWGFAGDGAASVEGR